jgi:hypothetical protein
MSGKSSCEVLGWTMDDAVLRDPSRDQFSAPFKSGTQRITLTVTGDQLGNLRRELPQLKFDTKCVLHAILKTYIDKVVPLGPPLAPLPRHICYEDVQHVKRHFLQALRELCSE